MRLAHALCALGLICVPAVAATTSTSRIVAAADMFLSTLDPKQRRAVLFAFDDHLVIEYAPQTLGGDPSMHVHTMYRDPTNDYGRKFTSQ
jgi:hypothetical protein